MSKIEKEHQMMFYKLDFKFGLLVKYYIEGDFVIILGSIFFVRTQIVLCLAQLLIVSSIKKLQL